MFPDLLIHIRHGETDWNHARRLQGSQNIPLNATGRQQARRNGERLKQWLDAAGRSPDGFDWVASPMDRARETMEIVRTAIGVPATDYRVEPRLTEVSFGRLEGLTYEDVEVQDPASYAAIRADKWNFTPPGGENYVVLTERVAASLADLRRDTVIVSHGGVFRGILSLLRGGHDRELSEFLVPQDQVFVTRGGGELWV